MNLLAAFIPGDAAAMLKPFRYDGRIYFDGKIKGPLAKDTLPLIEVAFGCENAWFHNPESDKRIDSLGFGGTYTNGAGRSYRLLKSSSPMCWRARAKVSSPEIS